MVADQEDAQEEDSSRTSEQTQRWRASHDACPVTQYLNQLIFSGNISFLLINLIKKNRNRTKNLNWEDWIKRIMYDHKNLNSKLYNYTITNWNYYH